MSYLHTNGKRNFNIRIPYFSDDVFFKRPVIAVILNEIRIEYHGQAVMNAQFIPAIRDVDYLILSLNY